MSTSPIDLFLVYSFLRRLVTPFKKWKAFGTGVIDADGKILVPAEKRTYVQKDSFKIFDVMIRNLKLLLAKIPGGSSRFATFTAALLLLREQKENITQEEFVDFMLQEEHLALFEEFSKVYPFDDLKENAPVNNVSGGAIAGVNGDGPVRLKNTNVLRRQKQNNSLPKYLRMNSILPKGPK
jgi:hypothetical protein